jgi:ABC-type transport system involved in multi-copper enzyme maturation permease subunit
MTAVADAVPAAPVRAHTGKVTQGRIIKSEWIKFRTLRSSRWSLIAGVGAMVAIALLFSFAMKSHYPHMSKARQLEVDPVADPMRGVFLGQLAVGVLGVMMITGEYTTGMIRASLAAAPKRLPVLWAKALVFTVVAWIVMTITSFVCFFLAQSIFSSIHLDKSLSDPGVLRAVFGEGLYLTVVGLLGVALGAIIRSTAGAIASLFGILLVLPVLGEVLNLTSWGDKVNPYLPSNAGQQVMAVVTHSPDLRPWPGFLLFVGYAVVAMAAAAVLLKKRDA